MEVVEEEFDVPQIHDDADEQSAAEGLDDSLQKFAAEANDGEPILHDMDPASFLVDAQYVQLVVEHVQHVQYAQ